MNYYNENDPKAAAWLRELIHAGEIPVGVVDERSIHEVRANDLDGFTQCHFFAGIGGWPYALRLAGWPDDRPVWTGSCPCQPFSVAGKGMGESDERHLWPDFRNLIGQCRPAIVFGEQVAGNDGKKWLAGVSADLEKAAYRFASANLCAAGVGSPQKRQRFFWVADTKDTYRRGEQQPGEPATDGRSGFTGDGKARAMADSNVGSNGRAMPQLDKCSRAGELQKDVHLEHPESNGREPWRTESDGRGVAGGCGPDAVAFTACQQELTAEPGGLHSESGEGGGMVQSNSSGRDERRFAGTTSGHRHSTQSAGSIGVAQGDTDQPRPQGLIKRRNCSDERTPWASSLVIQTSDGKNRRIPVEPGFFPLAYGVPGRVGLLRGYGNAIVPQVAAEFIMAAT